MEQHTIMKPGTDERVGLVWHDGYKDYSTDDQYQGRFFRATGDGRYFEYKEDGCLGAELWADAEDEAATTSGHGR
jgi:hypothetical protein